MSQSVRDCRIPSRPPDVLCFPIWISWVPDMADMVSESEAKQVTMKFLIFGIHLQILQSIVFSKMSCATIDKYCMFGSIQYGIILFFWLTESSHCCLSHFGWSYHVALLACVSYWAVLANGWPVPWFPAIFMVGNLSFAVSFSKGASTPPQAEFSKSHQIGAHPSWYLA